MADVNERPTALVTGGGSGIGAATCVALARDGYLVAVADRDDRAARAIAEQCGGIAFGVDVADEGSVVKLFAGAGAAFGGRLDALATSAGVSDTTPFMECTPELFARIYAINLIGTFLCIREASKLMRSGGRICTVSSVAGKRGGGLAGTAAYASSKGAVLALTRNAARSLAPRGISVNGICPSGTNTPMGEQVAGDTEQRARNAALIPLGRRAEAEEVAEAIVWLLSPRASYIEGEIVNVDGGLLMD